MGPVRGLVLRDGIPGPPQRPGAFRKRRIARQVAERHVPAPAAETAALLLQRPPVALVPARLLEEAVDFGPALPVQAVLVQHPGRE